MKTPKSTTTTTRTEIPEMLKPGLQRLIDRGESLYQTGPMEFYPGQTYAPTSPETEASLQMGTQRALGGGVTPYAEGLLGQTLSGGFLGANPMTDAAYQSAVRPITQAYRESTLPGLLGGFSQAGRYGSKAMESALGRSEEALGRTLSDTANRFYFDQYNQERARQQQALGLAPSIQQMGYGDIGMLGQIGAQREQIGQRGIDEAMQRYQYGQEAPYEQLRRYMGVITGTGIPMGQATTRPLYSSPAAQALGLGSLLFGGMGGGTPFGLLGGMF